jgi:predicted ATPase/DNA-binding XRE family transcriptional regulator
MGSASFGSLLRRHRAARGMSQEGLADRAGLSREAVSALERGIRRAPHRETIALLAKTLDLSAAERDQLQGAAAEAGERGPRSLVQPSPASGLPLRLTSFIGREREIAEVREILRAGRLVTIIGPGGIGKTSLAREVARAVEAQLPGGVMLVELAGLAEGDLVPQAIAAALGVREQPGEALLTTLGVALRPTQRLLLLDNCEHLVEACARIAEALLGACPRLQLLVTSREPLRVGAEVIWRVPALTLPGSDPQPLAELAKSEAVRLFVERARAVRPGFALAEGNRAAAAEICRRLDGIPLAIELAAARVAALPVEQIARRLDDRFRLLTTGSRTAMPRHQTLRALIDWSNDLLSEKEQILFRRLVYYSP